jgi:hypothetical protein
MLLFYIFFDYLGSITKRFTTEQLIAEAITTQDYIKRGSEGKASGYDIGAFDPSLGGILSKMTTAIQYSLYRPFLWEVDKVIQVIAALDSLMILLFTIYVLFKRRLSIILAIYKSPTIQFCLSFSLVFAGIMGFVSSNYGTLMRYKIPCIPFYVLSLILINGYGYKKSAPSVENHT